MSLKAKLAIAAAVSLLLVGGIILFVLKDRAPREAPQEEAAAEAPRAEAARTKPAAAKTEAPKAARAKKAAPEKKESTAKSAPPLPPGQGWTLAGRIVRDDPAREGEATTSTPVAGATVWLKPHPRRTKPENAPPPKKVVTGPDGKFEIAGVPGKIYLRLEVDEPTSAYRTFSFRFPDSPLAEERKELGDIPIEPGSDLVVHLIGPQGEPVEKGNILINTDSRNPNRLALLQAQGINESRRDAEEKGKGEYLIPRFVNGPVYLQVSAPGYAPVERATTELPRAEPFPITLEIGHSIAGIVLSEEGKPIAGAELTANQQGDNRGGEGHKAKSDAEGHFLFNTLGEGDCAVAVRAEGFVTASQSNVRPGTEDLNFSLALGASFEGKVVAEEGETPVAKATVLLRISGGGPTGKKSSGKASGRSPGAPAPRSSGATSSFSAETDGQGNFKVKNLPAGSYTIAVDHPDYAPAAFEEPRELKAGERTAGEILKLVRGFTATGKVVEAQSGEPVKDAQVSFDSRPENGRAAAQRTAKSGADGAFEVKGLRDGNYLLAASAKGYFSNKSQAVSIAEGGAKEFTIQLEQGSSIAGRVTDRSGAAVAGARVSLNVSFDASSNQNWQEMNDKFGNIFQLTATSGADGSYRLEGLRPHPSYTVQFQHRDFAPARVRAVKLEARQALEGIDIQLARGGTIRGRVLDEKGDGIAGANVSASPEQNEAENERYYYGNSSGSSGVSDKDGNYSLAHLETGPHQVQAQVKGRKPASKGGLQVAEEKTVEGIDLVLTVGEAFSGRVVDAEGSPVSGARIYIYSNGNGNSEDIRTDADGRFEAKGLDAGQAQFGISKAGYVSEQSRAAVPSTDNLITLKKASRVSGTLRTKAPAVFNNFQVTALQLQESGQPMGSRSMYQGDPNGSYSLDLGPGTYELQASVKGFAPSKSKRFTLKAAEDLEGIDIDLQEGGTIQGTIVAAGSGESISGAQIQAMVDANDPFGNWGGNPSASSDQEGNFTLDGVPEGTVSLTATHNSYAQTSVSGLKVSAGSTATARIEMSAGGAIRGLVLRDGNPLAGAMVSVNGNDPVSGFYRGKNATTDAAGRFEIKGLAAGDYQVGFMQSRRGGAFNRHRETVTVADGQTSEVTLGAQSGIRLSGRVLSGGEPVTGGNISAIRPEQGFDGANCQIDSDGRYSLELASAGAYSLMISRGGGEQGTKVAVTIPEGETSLEMDLELPSGEVSGLVIDSETGSPVSNVMVAALASGTVARNLMTLFDGLTNMDRTDAQGRFTIRNIAAGSYSLRAFDQGHSEGRLDKVALEEGGQLSGLKIILEHGFSVSAKVVDGSGAPVQGAMAFLRDSSGEMKLFQQPMMSGPDGTVVLDGLKAGVYSIIVNHQSFATGRATLRAAEGAEGPVITLQPAGTIQAQVLAGRRGVEGAKVQLLNEKGEDVLEDQLNLFRGARPSLTNSSGSLTLGQLSPGVYRAIAVKGKSRSREEKVAVAEGESAQVKLSLGE